MAWPLLAGIKSFLFGGGPEAVNTAVDTAAYAGKKLTDGFDHLFTSQEEKIEYGLEVGRMSIEMVKLTQNETTIRSVTRRLLAILISAVAIWLTLSAQFFFVVWAVTAAQDDKGHWIENAWKLSADFTLELLKLWWQPFLAVVILFFGYYGAMKWIEGRKNGKQ